MRALRKENTVDRKQEMRKTVVIVAFIVLLVRVCLAVTPALGQIYYMSTDGSDSNPGTSPKLAWQTIAYAARKAQAGDLVRIKGGEYGRENVVVANSGTAADDKLYCISEASEAVVLAAGDGEFKILSRIDMEDKPVQASIAIAEGRLYIRTASKLTCVSN